MVSLLNTEMTQVFEILHPVSPWPHVVVSAECIWCSGKCVGAFDLGCVRVHAIFISQISWPHSVCMCVCMCVYVCVCVCVCVCLTVFVVLTSLHISLRRLKSWKGYIDVMLIGMCSVCVEHIGRYFDVECILIQTSPKFVPKLLITNKHPLVRTKAGRQRRQAIIWINDNLVFRRIYACITRPQWLERFIQVGKGLWQHHRSDLLSSDLLSDTGTSHRRSSVTNPDCNMIKLLCISCINDKISNK